MTRVEVLPPETHEVRMPPGTPLGLGVLGAARFSAIRRVLEHAARAAHAKANLLHAETAVARAFVSRELAREQLRNLDAILEEERSRITEGARIAQLRRKLEVMELEDQVAAREAGRLAASPSSAVNSPRAEKREEEFTAFLREVQKLPEFVRAVTAAKEQVIRDAGGREKLSEAQQQVCDMFDAILLAEMSKRAGDRAL